MRTQAEQHAVRGEWAAALACFEQLLDLQPGDPDILLQLSYTSSFAGHYRAARGYALRANAAAPTDTRQLVELAARLRTFNAVPELRGCIARLSPLSRMPIPLLLSTAAQLSGLNLQLDALALLDEARRADPGYPPTLVARGQVLMYLGRLDEADRELRACLRRAPEISRTYWLLSGLRAQTPDDNLVDSIRTQLGRPGRRADEKAELAFALHKSMDDLGQRSAAWAALESACRIKRDSLRYSPDENDRLFDALRSTTTGNGARSASDQSGDARRPVFIVGMHRSGTTLLEQLLDRHADVQGAGELYDFTTSMRNATDHHCRGVIDATVVARSADVDFASVGASYLAGIEWRFGKQRLLIDKLPSNFLNLGFICRALPDARILHMVRDPMETCFSNLRELFSDANPFSYRQDELGRYYLQYRRLMAHWHTAYPGRILDVDYAALTSDPATVMQGVSAFVGVEYQAEMATLHGANRAIATASAVQARGQVVARSTPKWHAYAAELAPLKAIVG